MKKLMTMIAAVAMSFGLFAADTLNNSVSFATATNENPYATGDSLWAYTKDGASTAILKDEVQVKDNALVLETGSKVLSRKFAEQRVPFPENEEKLGEKGSLYANMTLDFNGEALEEIPDIGNSKIALFALDTSDWEAPTGEGEALPEQGTNIFVLASYGDPAQKALFMIKNFDGAALATERTVALKAYENVLSGAGQCGGFLLYINHSGDTEITPVSVSAVYLFDENDKVVWVDVIGGENGYLGRKDINGKLAKWITGENKNLFVSLDASPDTWNSLASVDFSGRAALSKITLANADDEDNPWPKDLVSMALSLTAAEIELTQDSKDAGFAIVDGAVTHPTGGEFSFTVASTEDYDNFTVLKGEAPVTPDAEGVYTTTLTDGGLLTVKSWEAAALVNGEPVESLFGADGAIAKVNQNGGTLKLMRAATTDGESVTFNGATMITLDLNGQTFTVTVEGDGYLANNGMLTILDSDPEQEGNIVGRIYNYGAMVVKSGTFNGRLMNTYDATYGNLAIEGGVFNDTVSNDEGCGIAATAGDFLKYDEDDETGTTEAAVKSFIDPENYEVVDTVMAGYWTVVPMANYVAQINETKFRTLAEAFDAAQADETIVMLSDIVLSERIFVKNEKVILDLAGKKIEWDTAVANASGVLIVCRDADLTIDNSVGTGVIDAKDVAYAAIAVTHGSDPKNSQTDLAAKLTVNGGTLKGYYYAVVGNGGRPNTVITINDGYLVSTCTNDGAGIYHPQKGTLNLNGGTIEGYTGVYIKAGDTACTVESEVKIIATGAKVPYDPDRKGDGFIATGDALFVDNCGYPGGEPNVDVKGGTFQSAYGAAVASVAKTGYTPIAGFVEGGTFTGNVKIDDAIAGGNWAFGPFVAGQPQSPVPAVAKIGTVNYASLDAAIAAAAENDTVTLLKDLTLTATLDIAKSVAIDLNQKTITFAADLATGIYAHNAGVVAIDNGTITVANGRQNIAGSKAIYLLRTSAAFENVVIDVPGFDYALTHMGNIADQGKNRSEYWTTEVPYTLDCDNVAVKGNGSLYHLEYVAADLDSNCTATQYTDKGYFSEAHQAAIYSSCGAVVTVNGGTYSAVNALQTGNLGGDIIVKGGEFNGNIKSWMLDNDTRDFAAVNKANITIEGGKFTGNFVYAANCSAESTLLKVEIAGGDFSDKTIPTAFIKPVEHKIAKWVDSTLAGYVTPGYDWEQVKAIWVVDTVATTNLVDYNTVPVKPADPVKTGYTFTGWQPEPGAAITEDTTYTAEFTANTYGINYTWVDNDGAAVTALDNTLPENFTFGGDAIELKAEMVTLTEAYTAVAFTPDTVTTDEAKEFAVTVTLTKKADEPKVDPEQPIPVPTGKTAEQVAEEMNQKGIANYLNIPTVVTDETAYTAMFEAKADGKGAVVIDLKSDVEKEIADQLANEATSGSMLNPDATTSEVTITAKPGLYYGIKAVGDVKTIGTAPGENWVQATGNSVNVVRPTVSGNAAFFQAVCTPKNPQINAGN